ncbi:MAG: carbohydrate ABC transporter permease [Lachnospiraceae bacterium]|nr:carbohydrate ABC transporter permease [Lachnospiraceae bacterium]
MAKKKERSLSQHMAAKKTVRYIVLIILTIICLFSFYILIINATRAHNDIQKGFSLVPGVWFLTNFKHLLSNGNLPVVRGMINSLIISGGSCILSTYFSALTAYAIHAYDFKGRKFVFTFILAIMMIPTQVTALGFVRFMNQLHLTDNFIPLIVPSIAAPTVFFFMKQYMESSLPLEIVEASRIDGAAEFKTFNAIIVPILKPAIAVQAIFTFVTAWNNYFTPNLLLSKTQMKTLPILIAQLRSADFLKFDLGQIYMMIFLAIIPVVIVYIALSKNIIQGIAVGAVKG